MSCVYFKKNDKEVYVYMLLYVDDILIASTDKAEVQKLKAVLGKEFDMKDLGDAKKILGTEITRDRVKGELSVSLEEYLWKVLGKFEMDQCKSVATPLGGHFSLKAATNKELQDQEEYMKKVPYQNAVGSVMYSMVGTRPDLGYAVGVISRFMSRPVKEHWQAVKWVLRYIKGSVDIKLSFKRKGNFVVRGYCDSDYGGDLDHAKSTIGMVFTAGGSPVSWRSSLQKVIVLSTTEAEYIALSEAVKEDVWLKRFAEELGFPQDTVEIFCGSQSAIALSKNAVFHERTKHMATKYHFIRDLIKVGEVQVLKIATTNNPSDIFTKVLQVFKMREALKMLRVTKD